ncbi:L domain-like protein [Trametes meyenii]|nr:L domain-like protein [Trametes meyenii]
MPRQREPDLLPMQQPPLHGWPTIEKQRNCEHCHRKRKRDRILLVALVVFLLYLFGNIIFLNVRTANLAPRTSSSSSLDGSSSASPAASTSSALSADAQQCISQYALNAPTDPQGYPCSTCYPVLSLVPANTSGGSSQDAQTIADAVQFCGLRSVFEGANDQGQTALSNGGWVKDARFCAWSGVRCDGFGRVSSLQLSFPSVPANIPNEIGGLTGLTTLQVVGDTNVPGGSLPPSFTQLTALTNLDLESTGVTTFDANLFSSLKKLTTLTLVKNSKMGTELPTSLFGINLQNLVINGQTLGSDTLSNIASSSSLRGNLKLLDLSSTSLSSPIPSTISSLASLVELHLDNNALTNPLPAAFPPSLQTLTLANNTQLTGALAPGAAFCALAGLQTCDARGTGLSAQGACGACRFA